MKRIILIILFSWNSLVFAQATANFTASVTIIEPISIKNQSEMNFTSISASSGGTVVLESNDRRFSTGGVELEKELGAMAATFFVTGEEGMTEAVTLPKNKYRLKNGEQHLVLHSFTSNLPESFQLSGDPVTLKVGATIDIEDDSDLGDYRSILPLSVMVNYN